MKVSGAFREKLNVKVVAYPERRMVWLGNFGVDFRLMSQTASRGCHELPVNDGSTSVGVEQMSLGSKPVLCQVSKQSIADPTVLFWSSG